jgi:hypothetical protein
VPALRRGQRRALGMGSCRAHNVSLHLLSILPAPLYCMCCSSSSMVCALSVYSLNMIFACFYLFLQNSGGRDDQDSQVQTRLSRVSVFLYVWDVGASNMWDVSHSELSHVCAIVS